jgi:acetyltransferase
MSTTASTGYHTLELFFRPRSVAMIGATDKEGTAGQIVLRNLLMHKKERTIYPVNPHRQTIFNEICYPSVSDLPDVPNLVVIVTPANTVAGIMEDCGKVGVKAAIIISSGFKEAGPEGEKREIQLAEIMKKYSMRVIGPNCMGIIRPGINLNTTFIHKMPKAGNVAFLSQSGALGAGILDWAVRRNLGFSAFISLGSMLDVDFGDAIDFFGGDPDTRSIIIYPESLGNTKKFMSAARGFARSKPIIALKPGKYEETARAVKSHTGALVGEDLHYDAIFRRAGVIRV